MSEEQEAFLQRLVDWGSEQPLVRAMLLTSTRAIPGGVADELSDYDVILALADVRPFYEDRAWLEAFGPVLALYRDPLADTTPMGLPGSFSSAYVTQYEHGLKIDFSLWPAELLPVIAAAPQLLDELDAGYRVLLDKDNLTAGMRPPTYAAYIPTSPDEAAYQKCIEEFFLEAGYAAKYLWREDMMAAKYLLDYYMKHEHLRPMLEWHMECQHGWKVKPGPYGRRLQHWLRPDLWAGLERTYTGIGLQENWDALYASVALMRQAAQEVGACLGYSYPDALEQRVLAFLRKVQHMPPGGTKK